jgi:hypothetical protein
MSAPPSAQAEGVCEVVPMLDDVDEVAAGSTSKRARASSSPQNGKNAHQRQSDDVLKPGGAVLDGQPVVVPVPRDDPPPPFRHCGGGGESRRSYGVVKYCSLYEGFLKKVVGRNVVFFSTCVYG